MDQGMGGGAQPGSGEGSAQYLRWYSACPPWCHRLLAPTQMVMKSRSLDSGCCTAASTAPPPPSSQYQDDSSHMLLESTTLLFWKDTLL